VAVDALDLIGQEAAAVAELDAAEARHGRAKDLNALLRQGATWQAAG
jgi:hypothetical protein